MHLARQGLPPLHLGRKRELVQLLRHFSQQHEDGVCGVATFKELIKLEYPKAFPDEHRAMLEFVTMLNAYEEAAATEAKVKQQQVEQLFRAIDADASGCIDEGEFVRELERASEQHGLSAEALVRPQLSPNPDPNPGPNPNPRRH